MIVKSNFIITLFVSQTLTGFSQWNANTTINTPVTIALKSQQNIHSVADTKDGVILTWDDNRNNTVSSTDVYAQRIKSDGTPKWLANGLIVCDAVGIQKSNNITSGGIDASAIITWEDGRAGNYDIYAQKIDSSGNVLWGTNGVVICNKTTNQKNPKIISDNAGGAIVVWEDSVNFYFDIYAQRINNLGVPQWASNGVAICTAPNQQQNPTLDIDGLGGAIITWQDKRNNSDYDIYAQQITSNATLGWAVNGIVVCNAVNTQSNPRIEPDGSNGAIIGWVDKRNGLDYDVFSQRINASGTPLWATNGATVCLAATNQSAIDMKYLGATGVLFAWKDDRAIKYQIYSQLLNLSGASQLVTNGVALSNGLKAVNSNMVRDGFGGAIVAWQDSSTIGWDIKAQKINSSGVAQWSVGGVVISDAVGDQVAVSHCADTKGGAIFCWEDNRNGTDVNLYAQHAYNNGLTSVGIEELKTPFNSICYPNPINNNSIIQLNEIVSDWHISITAVLGEMVVEKHIIGQSYYPLNKSTFNEGVYFYTISVGNKSIRGTFISVK